MQDLDGCDGTPGGGEASDGEAPDPASIDRPVLGLELAPQTGDHMLAFAEVVPHEILIHMNGERHRVPYAKGQTILRAARAAGLFPAFSCEAGLCGACSALRLAGRVELAYNEVYSRAELAEGWILTCQAHAFGPSVEISYDVP